MSASGSYDSQTTEETVPRTGRIDYSDISGRGDTLPCYLDSYSVLQIEMRSKGQNKLCPMSVPTALTTMGKPGLSQWNSFADLPPHRPWVQLTSIQLQLGKQSRKILPMWPQPYVSSHSPAVTLWARTDETLPIQIMSQYSGWIFQSKERQCLVGTVCAFASVQIHVITHLLTRYLFRHSQSGLSWECAGVLFASYGNLRCWLDSLTPTVVGNLDHPGEHLPFPYSNGEGSAGRSVLTAPDGKPELRAGRVFAHKRVSGQSVQWSHRALPDNSQRESSMHTFNQPQPFHGACF